MTMKRSDRQSQDVSESNRLTWAGSEPAGVAGMQLQLLPPETPPKFINFPFLQTDGLRRASGPVTSPAAA
jgi:hypothetical protein